MVLPETEPVTRPPYLTISASHSGRSSESNVPVMTNVCGPVFPARQPGAPTGSFLLPRFGGAVSRMPGYHFWGGAGAGSGASDDDIGDDDGAPLPLAAPSAFRAGALWGLAAPPPPFAFASPLAALAPPPAALAPPADAPAPVADDADGESMAMEASGEGVGFGCFLLAAAVSGSAVESAAESGIEWSPLSSRRRLTLSFAPSIFTSAAILVAAVAGGAVGGATAGDGAAGSGDALAGLLVEGLGGGALPKASPKKSSGEMTFLNGSGFVTATCAACGASFRPPPLSLSCWLGTACFLALPSAGATDEDDASSPALRFGFMKNPRMSAMARPRRTWRRARGGE